MKTIKLLMKIVLAVSIVFLLIFGGMMFYLSRGLETGAGLELSDVNVKDIDDGTYTGKYEAGRWSNEVSVTVKDHKIIGIEIVKDVRFPKPEVAKELINRVMEKQSTKVDAVSQATVTSKAYLKSIENALGKQQ